MNLSILLFCLETILTPVFGTSVTATCYNASVKQTDSTPFITAFNFRINPENPFSHKYLAVSRDLLLYFNPGDTVIVSGTFVYDGYWIVADKMNKRFHKRIDFLVPECGHHAVFKAHIKKYYGRSSKSFSEFKN